MAKGALKASVPVAYGPRLERDVKFCERWLVHFDHVKAYREAGFKGTPETIHSRAKAKLERFAAYLRPLQEAKSQKVGEQLAIGEETVLRQMAAIAFFNPAEYVERGTAPLTRTVESSDGQTRQEIVTFNGRPVYPYRLKPMQELTREQMAAVEVYTDKWGNAHYALPPAKVRHQYLDSIGRQLGMFAEKLILERHNHKYKHMKLDLTGVSSEQLQQMTRMLLPLLGEDFARELGVEDMLALPAPGG